MAAVGRVGADTVGGGTVITGALSVMTNDLPTVIVGSNVAPHHTHRNSQMVVGFPGVLVEDFPICRLGDPSSCGHVLISYSDVEVG